MNVTIPEDFTVTNRNAYMVGMQEFKASCISCADAIFGDDFEKSNDLAKEFFYTFYAIADGVIRGALEDLALYGLPTVKQLKQGARYAITVMVREMSLHSLLEIKEYDLIYA